MSRAPSAQEERSLLEIQGLSHAFRGLLALNNYSLRLRPGEILGVIGPNGAGKTTLFNLITGVLRPTAGQILFDGQDITGQRPERIARMGIARTFQNIRLFDPLPVLENVRVGLQMHNHAALWQTLLSLPAFARSETALATRAGHLLGLMGLDAYADQPAGSLPYGLQRRLEIASALATRPRVLLLDEPAAGMNPVETDALMDLIRHIHHLFDLTIILIEHNMQVIMGICERIQALNYGQIIAEGAPKDIQNHPDVIEAYLGSAVGSLNGAA